MSVSVSQARLLAEEAYIYGFALVENYKAMYGMAILTSSPAYSGFNRYLHGRTLFDADYTTVVNANNDTLYSTAFADLRAEPLVITVPPTGSRYFVIQLVDMSTDNIGYIGTRATGSEGGTFLLVGPSHKGPVPPGPWTQVISAPSEFVALATRTAVAGADDLPGVVAVQDGLLLQPLSASTGHEPPPPPPPVSFPAYDPRVYGTPQMFGLLNFLLPFTYASVQDHATLSRISRIGVGPHRDFELGALDPDIQEAIAEGTEAGQRRIEERGNRLGTVVQGWQDIPAMGSYGTNYLFRSAVAWKFIYTNSPEEALYPIAEADADGERLDGVHRYEIRFAPGTLPPVDAFWSITLYDSASRLMVHNPIDRFSIGDRTPGLRYADDGSLTIVIQHDRPAAQAVSNWLPAPRGAFYLNVRAYAPRQAMVTGSYRLPPVTRVQ